MAKPGEAMRPKTATYVTLFDPKKLVNLMSMSDAKCETFHIYIYIYMLDGPLGSIVHPTGSSRYMATLDTQRIKNISHYWIWKV